MYNEDLDRDQNDISKQLMEEIKSASPSNMQYATNFLNILIFKTLAMDSLLNLNIRSLLWNKTEVKLFLKPTVLEISLQQTCLRHDAEQDSKYSQMATVL